MATLLQVRARKSRVLLGHFIKILILLRTRALLGHLTSSQSPEFSRLFVHFIKILILLRIGSLLGDSFQDRVRKSRVLLGHYIKILILLSTRALLGHLTSSQSTEISRITWPLYENSYTPRNSRITWLLFSGQTSFNSRITRTLMYLYQS